MATFINGFEVEKFNIHNFKENEKYSTCPLCSEHRQYSPKQKCCTIFWETGTAHCSHCGEYIQLHTYKKRKTESKKIYKKPVLNNKTELSDKLVAWFENRKISQKTLLKMRITESMEFMPPLFKKQYNCINFNYFRDDELINIKFRDAKKEFKIVKEAELIFYNLDAIRTSDECLIVEGEIDCSSWIEVNYSYVVSIPNGSTLKGVNLEYLDNCIDYFSNKTKIYLALDNDEAGRNVTKELIRRLGAERCYLIDFDDCKDSNEYHVKHGAEKLRLLKENANPCPLENVFTYKDCENELYDFYLNGAPKGFTCGLKSLDDVFSVLLGQSIIIGGVPTHGKSDFIDQMIVGYNILHGWKTAYVTPENNPMYIHLDKIIRKFYGKRPELSEFNSDNFILTKNHINDNFFFIDFDEGFELELCLKKIEELIRRKGIRCFVLDPFNKIRLTKSLNKSITDYTNDYMNMFNSFCKKHNVLGILAAHIVKPDKFKKPNINDLSLYDIKGGGEFFDMAIHGLLLFRDFEQNKTYAKIGKCKFQHLGKNNAIVTYGWNSINGRYTEIVGSTEDVITDSQLAYTYDNLLIKSNTSNNITSNVNFDNENYIIDEMPF